MTTEETEHAARAALKVGVIQQAAEGRAVRARMLGTTDRARYDLWDEKRRVGAGARVYLLAYAYARRRSYRATEATAGLSRYDNPAPVMDVRDLLAEVGVSVSKEELLAWFEAPESATRKAKRLAAEAKGRALREEKRAAAQKQREAAA